MQTPKLDPLKLTPEERDKLEDYTLKKDTLQAMTDVADMLQEVVLLLDKTDAVDRLDKMGALLVDMRGALRSLDSKEAPEQPEIAQPVVDAISKLEKALTKAVGAQKAPVVNVPKQGAPVVNIDAPTIDLSKVEKILKTDLPKAFEQAIQRIVIPENDDAETNQLLSDIAEQLMSIDVGVRLKPEPGVMKVTGVDGGAVPITGTITAEASTLAEFQFNDSDDTTTASTEYFGYTKPDGTWLVKKLTDTTLRYATVTNNGAVTTYADAWAAIASLTYGRMDQAF